MINLNVKIDNKQYKKFGFKSKNISFDELYDELEEHILRQMAKKALRECTQIAKKNDLSKI